MLTAKQHGMVWMNTTFGTGIEKAIAGTPFTKNLVIAIGIQETFYIWAELYKTGTPEKVLSACVGDTLDFPRRASAWPKNRAELEAHAKGKEMFKIARAALEDIAKIPHSGYQSVVKNPDKFCHGFGMFQYDIQFFENEDPDYFLSKRWMTWDGTVGKGVAELTTQMRGLYGKNKTVLTYDESVYVAIAYNQGAKKTKAGIAKGHRFQQGHEDSNGVFYGEHIDSNLQAMNGLW
jgi:hypothetical protein